MRSSSISTRCHANARGLVEFRTTVFILKPVDLTRGNGKIYYTANNRGNDALYTARTVEQVGRNDFALRLGYTIVDAGWQGDLAPSPTRLGGDFPIARQPDGSPIVGTTRVEFSDRNIPRDGAFTSNLKGGAAFKPYEAADLNTSHATFTVRDTVSAPRKAIAPDRWAFGRCASGRDSLVASGFDICYFDRFDPDKIYELIYAARNPIVMGLGHAATRDLASFLRYETDDRVNPLAGRVRRVYATGASQTGGFLRDFIYLGFNQDEAHRRVFDGVIPTIAGTDRVFINVRFADPNVYSGQDDRHDFLQNSHPPFTYAVVTDPLTGIRDGILKRPATDPVVFQVDSATEFWQLRASLNVADADGRGITPPANVRLYFVSSTSHGFGIGGLLAAAPASNSRCALPTPSGVGRSGAAAARRTGCLGRRRHRTAGHHLPARGGRYARHRRGCACRFSGDSRDAIPWIAEPSRAARLRSGVQPARRGDHATTRRCRRAATRCSSPRPIATVSISRASTSCRCARRSARPRAGTSAPRRRARTICAGCPDRTCRSPGPRPSGRHPVIRGNLSKSGIVRTQGFVEAVEKAARQLVNDRFLDPEDAERYVAAARASDVLR